MTAMHTVDVSGKLCVVTVRQKSKSLWTAQADYMGDSISAEGRSEEAALSRWQQLATSKGDSGRKKPQPRAKSSRKRGTEVSAKRQPARRSGAKARKKPAAKRK